MQTDGHIAKIVKPDLGQSKGCKSTKIQKSNTFKLSFFNFLEEYNYS